MGAEPLRLEVRDRHNQPVGELELPREIFGGPIRTHLLYEAVKMWWHCLDENPRLR